MTRGEIRTVLREDILNEPTEGFWTNTELNRIIQRACDRVARETNIVVGEYQTTTIDGVGEYELPQDFKQLKAVRYDDGNTIETLAPISKGILLDRVTNIGDPTAYYISGGIIGLDPVPNVAASTKYNDSTLVDGHSGLTDTGALGQSYQVSTAAINAHNVRLYLRKDGRPVGGIYVEVVSGGFGGTVEATSRLVDVVGVESYDTWVSFNFEPAPVNLAATTYHIQLRGDATYQASYVAGATEIQWAVDASSPSYADGNFATFDGVTWTADATRDAMFEVFPLQNDLIVEYYKSKCNEMDDDNDSPEVPDGYHQLIIDLAASVSLGKNGYDRVGASQHRQEAEIGMQKAAGDALRQRGRGRGRIGPAYRQGKIVVVQP